MSVSSKNTTEYIADKKTSEITNDINKFMFIDSKTLNGLGVLNINGGYNIIQKQEPIITNKLIELLESTRNISKKNNKKSIIINIYLQNYKLNFISKKFILNIVKILTTLYPDDLLHQCNLVNPSFISEKIILLIKNFIPNKEKLKIIKGVIK